MPARQLSLSSTGSVTERRTPAMTSARAAVVFPTGDTYLLNLVKHIMYV